MPKGMTGDVVPSGYRTGGLQQFNPEQMQLFQQLMGMMGPDSFLSKLAGGDQSMFEEMEAPAWRQLQEAQGGLASRFSGMGGGAMSARKGSGFQNMANQQSQDFAMGLQSQRQQLQQQALMDMMNMGNMLMGQRPFEKFMTQKRQKQNPWADIMGALGGEIPGAITGAFTGGA